MYSSVLSLLQILSSYDPAHILPQLFVGITPGLVKAVISIYIVYPLSYLHRQFLFRKPKTQQLLFFLISGGAVIYYVIGLNGLLHCLFNVVLVWITKRVFGPSKMTVTITTSVTMVYLVVGYILNKRVDVYDVWWTTPHSIQTMKLIGLAFDYLDGNSDKERLDDYQKKYAIKDFTFLEMLTFCFTYTGGLFGPQIPFKRFRDFTDNTTTVPTDMHGKPNSVSSAMYKLGVGSVFIALYLPLGVLFNRDTVISPEFNNECFIFKMVYLIGFGVNALIKYIGCWTVVEGGCVLVGMSYNPDLSDKWDGMKSVDPYNFFFSFNNKSFIDNFNMTTKDWFIRYLFKRTRGLGKWVSMSCTYLFIILWHGVRPGYWLAFLFEVPVVMAEKQLMRVVRHYCGPYETWRDVTKFACLVVSMVTRFIALGYGAVPFILLTWTDSAQVYHGVYWFLHIALVCWLLLFYLIVEQTLPPRTAQSKTESTETKVSSNSKDLSNDHIKNECLSNGSASNNYLGNGSNGNGSLDNGDVSNGQICNGNKIVNGHSVHQNKLKTT